MTKASTIFPSEDDPGAKAKEIRAWLVAKGVRDFEPVSLLCDQLDKVCPLTHRRGDVDDLFRT
jgi:5'-3' exoribonuclease 1